jgi:hypothetical protein
MIRSLDHLSSGDLLLAARTGKRATAQSRASGDQQAVRWSSSVEAGTPTFLPLSRTFFNGGGSFGRTTGTVTFVNDAATPCAASQLVGHIIN